MATNLKLKTGTIDNYNNITSKENGTIYFATDTDGRAYIYLNGNNIVPKLADLRNGGLGVDLTNAAAYSVLLRGNGSYDTTYATPASGAFYTDSTSNKPKFGTLPVAQGGSGITSIPKGAILYGNVSSTTGAISTLSPTINGYILVSTGANKAPAYVQPTMSWTNGSTAGPIFNFTFNTKEGSEVKFAGVAIPKASDSISGIITTDGQTFTGEKTLMSTTHASSIYPRTSKSYSLGYWTSISDNRIWSNVVSRAFQIFDGNGYKTGEWISNNPGTTTNDGFCGLILGNNIPSGTAGTSRGILYLYGQNANIASIEYGAHNEDSVFSLPCPGVSTYITPTRQSAYNVTTATSSLIPFYVSTGSATSLGYNDGFLLRHKNGDTSTTPGMSYLYLGNATAVGTAGNKTGGIFMFGDNSGTTAFYPNKSNGTNHYSIFLPAASGELVYHTEDAAQGGSGRLISVSAAGQIVADTSTDIASDVKLMYLKDGLLTASAATKGSGVKLIHLSSGAITESTSNVASGTELMYLTNGTLIKSTSGVAGSKQLMHLVSGKLTASDADEGSGVKPVYLSKGVITASTSSVAKSTQLMYMSNGTLTASTADVGSATQPVYLLDGVVTAAGAYSSLLTAFSGADDVNDNTMSITVGGTTDTATIIGGVSNTWTNGTTNGPTLSTTVNGITGTAAQIPNASYSYSGAVTTSTQTFKGVKTFGDGMKVSAAGSTTDCATFTYDASTDTLTISFP